MSTPDKTVWTFEKAPEPVKNPEAELQKFLLTTKPHLVILTPCYNSSLYAGYTESLLKTMFMCKDLNIPATIHFCRNDSLVSRARNNLIAKAMSMPEATHFLFIDADITWDPHDILKLLIADKPIVGGIYPIKNYQWNKIGENPNFLAELLERKK